MQSPRLSTVLFLAALGGCHARETVEAQSRALSAGFQVGAARSFGANTTDRAYLEHGYPSVAYGGGVFLTVWCSIDNHKLYAVRTRASDGAVLDDRRLLLARLTFTTPVAVDWDGQNFLVVWSDYEMSSSSYKLYGIRVGSDGKLVDPTPIVMRPDAQLTQLAMARSWSSGVARRSSTSASSRTSCAGTPPRRR